MKFFRLDKPYQRNISGIRFVLFSIASGVFVAIFLIVFQPYGLYEWQNENKYLFISGFGVVTTLTLLLTFLVQEVWMGKKIETLGQQLFSLFFRTFLIGLANIGYAMLIGRIELSASTALWFIWITFSIGIFPVIGLLLYDLFKQLRSGKDSDGGDDEEDIIHIKSENKNEKFSIKARELLIITSADNYCELYLFDGNLKKALIRGTLTDIEDQISHPEIVRCHRSHIINLDKVEDYEGNSQGLKLYFPHLEDSIRVSRKYVNDVKKNLDKKVLKNKNFITLRKDHQQLS